MTQRTNRRQRRALAVRPTWERMYSLEMLLRALRIPVRAIALGALLAGAAAAQSPAPGNGQATGQDSDFDPTGYAGLLAYERAYPASPAHPLVVQAANRRYWVFRNVA
ncbi:MAG: hypothetical protein PVJ51_04205, partial [Acidobacteriota bacterium]